MDVMSLGSSVTTTDISDVERRILQHLAAKLDSTSPSLALSNSYYWGLQAVPSLGISTPPELESLATIMGWAKTGVDATTERLRAQGFRMPMSTSTSDDLQAIWQANNLDDEQGLVYDDAQIFGAGYAVVGSNPDNEQLPLITIESPLTMTAIYDHRKRAASCALQRFSDTDPVSEHYGKGRAVLYVPGATIHLVQDKTGNWVVAADRDNHGAKIGRDVVPVVPFPNNRRTGGEGMSEVTDAWRNTINRACRAQKRLEVISEFFAAQKLILLGVAEEDFQKSDGTAKSAWETYIGRVLALQRDGDGNLPQVERFPAESPDGLIKVVDQETKNMAGLTGLPPHYLGIFSDGNPASADAIRMSDFRLKMKADRKTIAFGNAWEQVMRLALLIRDGALPDGADSIETDWAATGIPTPASDTDAVTKQISVGMVPPTSDVAASKVGYTAVERARIANEWNLVEGNAAIDRILRGGTGGDAAPTGVDDATELKARAEAMGQLIRAGVNPQTAAERAGLPGLTFIEGRPITIRKDDE